MGKPKERTDGDRLAWLARCEKVDRTGFDGGWSFELIAFPVEKGPVMDIRIATRGLGTRLKDSLVEAIDSAMDVGQEL